MSSPTETPATTEAQETAAEWGAYIRSVLSERGWRQLDLANYLDMDQRVVRYWVSGKVLPARSLRRALRLALMAPAEAEVMRCLIGALRAAQAATIDHGAGVARKAAPSGGARREPPAPAPSYFGDDGEGRQPMPQGNLPRGPVGGAADSPTSPPPPSQAALAAALARRKKP